MEWQLNDGRPIYAQLVEQLQRQIISGAYLPGARLEPVRELAAQAGVNPNTMQRALMELERQELVYSQRTSGRFITHDGEQIARLRHQVVAERIEAFLAEMATLGVSREEILSLLREREEEST